MDMILQNNLEIDLNGFDVQVTQAGSPFFWINQLVGGFLFGNPTESFLEINTGGGVDLCILGNFPNSRNYIGIQQWGYGTPEQLVYVGENGTTLLSFGSPMFGEPETQLYSPLRTVGVTLDDNTGELLINAPNGLRVNGKLIS